MSQTHLPEGTRGRDIRLDVFRGIAMIVILIAHITDNPWTLYMPGRFGFSDSTEIFVFCSGVASALAYGAVFHRASWVYGTLRVIQRIWQLYWVHLGIFFAALLAMLLINHSGMFARDEVGALNLYPFLRNTGPNFLGLMTLTYVPNYFDILPMYIVVMALMPLLVLLARLSPKLALLASVALWAVGTSGLVSLPAEWWFVSQSTRAWFFNPFAWQLVFFTGYGLVAGWIPVPPRSLGLTVLAAGVVILAVPFAWYVPIGKFKFLQDWRSNYVFLYDKTGLGVLRYLHFLALAYLAWMVAGEGGARLTAAAKKLPWLFTYVTDIGRQSLAVFALSMVLARVLGAFLHQGGATPLVTLLINTVGLFLIWVAARAAGWFKSQGWKKHMMAEADARPWRVNAHGVNA